MVSTNRKPEKCLAFYFLKVNFLHQLASNLLCGLQDSYSAISGVIRAISLKQLPAAAGDEGDD